MSDKIKPCPLCGGEAEAGIDGDCYYDSPHYVWCIECSVEIFRSTKEEALKAWNKRKEVK